MSKVLERRPHEVVWDRQKISEYWDVFGNIKPVSPWFSVKARGFILKELKRIQSTYFSGKRLKILDLGSGSGELLDQISKVLDFDCYGIDTSPERIENASKDFPHITFQVGSLTESGFQEQTFDIVISTQTIEHLLDEDLNQAFREMSRILVPGGMMFLTTRFEEDIKTRRKVCPDCLAIFLHSQHLQSFTTNDIDNLMEAHNCKSLISKKSRCRDNLGEYLPKEIKFMDKILFFFFGRLFDRRKGKYIFALGQKK